MKRVGSNLLYMCCFLLISVVLVAICIGMWFLAKVNFSEFGTDSLTDKGVNLSASEPCLIIDAGHGGEDGGAVGVLGTLEKDLNLAVASTMECYAKVLGIPVQMTRSEDCLLSGDAVSARKNADLKNRTLIAKEHPKAVFLSIHMNSFVGAKCQGLQVFYSKNHERSKEIAQSIQELCATVLQKDNTRVPKAAGSNIYLLDRIQNPAVLVECGFISDAEEEQRLCSEKYQKQTALMILGAVCPFLQYTKEP